MRFAFRSYRGNSSKSSCPSHINIVGGNVCRVEKLPPTEAEIMYAVICGLFIPGFVLALMAASLITNYVRSYLVQHGPVSVSLNAGHLQHYRR